MSAEQSVILGEPYFTKTVLFQVSDLDAVVFSARKDLYETVAWQDFSVIGYVTSFEGYAWLRPPERNGHSAYFDVCSLFPYRNDAELLFPVFFSRYDLSVEVDAVYLEVFSNFDKTWDFFRVVVGNSGCEFHYWS